MKIVFCTQNLAPFRMKWIDEIAKTNFVIVYHLGIYEKKLNNKYISYETKHAIVRATGKPLFNFLGRYEIRKILNEKADIYLLDGYGFAGIQELILALVYRGIPFLMSIDGGFIRRDNLIKSYLKRFFISSATSFFSTSKETDKYINYYGGVGKKYRHLFSNFYSDYIEDKPANFIEKQRLKDKLRMDSVFTVISVGKFEHRKGFDLLIKAVDELDINVQLYLIGSSENRPYSGFITDKTRDRIHFVEFCSQEELKEYYRAADLMILPTREDVWGLVISEAMANGVITITTNKCLAGIAMLNKDDIIPVDDINSIVRKIELYYFMPENEKLKIGQRNIEISRKYAIDAAVKDDLKHLRDFYYENIESR